MEDSWIFDVISRCFNMTVDAGEELDYKSFAFGFEFALYCAKRGVLEVDVDLAKINKGDLEKLLYIEQGLKENE